MNAIYVLTIIMLEMYVLLYANSVKSKMNFAISRHTKHRVTSHEHTPHISSHSYKRKVISFGLGQCICSTSQSFQSPRRSIQIPKHMRNATAHWRILYPSMRTAESARDIVRVEYLYSSMWWVRARCTYIRLLLYYQHIVTDMNCHINIVFVLEFIRQWFSSRVSHSVRIDYVGRNRINKIEFCMDIVVAARVILEQITAYKRHHQYKFIACHNELPFN